MVEFIGQRKLRNDSAEIMRRVEAGESFTVTRNGKPVADLVPHRPEPGSERPRGTLADLQALFRRLPPVDAEQWRRDLEAADEIFAPDNPFEDPWDRRRNQDQATKEAR